MPTSSSQRSRAAVDVFRYQDYRAFLAAFYAAKKRAGFSYRRFSIAVGLGAPNYLKLVIDGKRNLSASMAERFAKACKLQGDSAEYFCLLVRLNQAHSDAERNATQEQLVRFARFRRAQPLELAQKDYHSSWFVPVVRELVACRQFVADAGWVAQAVRPPITEKQAEHALEVLVRLGLIEVDAAGRYRQSSRAVSTGAQASGLHIRNYHAEMMQRATAAMELVPAAERFIASLTLSVSPRLHNEVMRRVHQFRAELVELCDAELDPSQVVQLNLQLFPVSRELSPSQAAGAATERRDHEPS